MDELKAYLEEGFTGTDQEKKDKDKSTPKKDTSATDKKNMELAKLYEDIAEYEEELEAFEKELEVIKTNELKDIPSMLAQKLPDEDRNYAQELKAILVASWTHLVEVEKTHSAEYLGLITQTEFCDLVEVFNSTYPEYAGSFETDVKNILIKRLEALISIKKEHIKEEEDDLYIAGLKPSFVKRMYKQVHGIK